MFLKGPLIGDNKTVAVNVVIVDQVDTLIFLLAIVKISDFNTILQIVGKNDIPLFQLAVFNVAELEQGFIDRRLRDTRIDCDKSPFQNFRIQWIGIVPNHIRPVNMGISELFNQLDHRIFIICFCICHILCSFL